MASGGNGEERPWEVGQEEWRMYPEDQGFMELDESDGVWDRPNDQVLPLEDEEDDDDPVQIEEQIVHLWFADDEDLHQFQPVDLESVGEIGEFQHRLGFFDDVNSIERQDGAFGRSVGVPGEDQLVPTWGASDGQPGRIEEELAHSTNTNHSPGEGGLEVEGPPLNPNRQIFSLGGSEALGSLFRPANSSSTLP